MKSLQILNFGICGDTPPDTLLHRHSVSRYTCCDKEEWKICKRIYGMCSGILILNPYHIEFLQHRLILLYVYSVYHDLMQKTDLVRIHLTASNETCLLTEYISATSHSEGPGFRSQQTSSLFWGYITFPVHLRKWNNILNQRSRTGDPRATISIRQHVIRPAKLYYNLLLVTR